MATSSSRVKRSSTLALPQIQEANDSAWCSEWSGMTSDEDSDVVERLCECQTGEPSDTFCTVRWLYVVFPDAFRFEFGPAIPAAGCGKSRHHPGCVLGSLE